MSKIREAIEQAFNEEDIDRVDKNIDSIKSSLIGTNQLFTKYTLLIFTTILSYHLVLIGEFTEITIFGVKLASKDFILKWFLIIPSALMLFQAMIGYLRVYQQDSIRHLLSIYRTKEYDTELYRIAFPANNILALDLMNRINTKIAPKSLNIFINVAAILAISVPSIYIICAYGYSFHIYGYDWQLIISFIISFIIIWQRLIIIKRSQEI